MKKFIYTVLMALIFILAVPFAANASDVRDDIISEAKQHMGTPYVWGGTSPSGFDCSGFLNYVFEKNGVDLPRTVAEMYKLGTSVSKSNLQKGDIVYFETYKAGPSHAGIYIGNSKFIHASSSKGITIDSINNQYYWAPKYIGAKRIVKDTTLKASANETVEKEPEPIRYDTRFWDVGEHHWAYESIENAAKNNLVNGMSDGSFRPSDAITREQAASILSAYLGLNASGSSVPFSDVNKDSWSYNGILAAHEAGLFKGDENNKFNPKDELTRAEFAALMARANELSLTDGNTPFTDLSNTHWASEEIKAVTNAKLFEGYEDGTFKPTKETTRAEFVKVLNNN